MHGRDGGCVYFDGGGCKERLQEAEYHRYRTPCQVLLLCLAPLTKKNKNLHLLAYSALAEGARELWMVRTTAGSHDPNNGSGLSEARPKAADELVSGARFNPPQL